MATRGVRNRRQSRQGQSRPGQSRVVYLAAGVCFTLAALAGVVAAAGASTSSVVLVNVHDFAFSPDSVTVAKGTVVRFTNTGNSLHRVVSDDGSFDSHPLQPGHNATFTFTTVGVFHLHCEIHPTMQMTVTVLASAPAAGTGASSGTSKSATAALPQSLPRTGSSSAVIAIVGLGLILLGMLFLALGRSTLATIPTVAAVPTATLARVMGWENRFDDLLPGRRRG